MAESAEFVTQITGAQRQLHAFILSMVWNPAEADDVLQETNLALWEKADEFDGSRPFLPWAMRFAQLQAMAWLKRRKRQRLVFDDDLAKLLADEAAAQKQEQELDTRRQALGLCLQKLEPNQRELIARRYEPDASVNAMAEAVGITPKAVSDRLRRIRRDLPPNVVPLLMREWVDVSLVDFRITTNASSISGTYTPPTAANQSAWSGLQIARVRPPAVPEPATATLAMIGLGGLIMRRRRKA